MFLWLKETVFSLWWKTLYDVSIQLNPSGGECKHIERVDDIVEQLSYKPIKIRHDSSFCHGYIFD